MLIRYYSRGRIWNLTLVTHISTCIYKSSTCSIFTSMLFLAIGVALYWALRVLKKTQIDNIVINALKELL